MWVKLVTHDTRHAAVQRTSDIGATETEESITRGKDQEARGIGQSAEPQYDSVILSTISLRVKKYKASSYGPGLRLTDEWFVSQRRRPQKIDLRFVSSPAVFDCLELVII